VRTAGFEDERGKHIKREENTTQDPQVKRWGFRKKWKADDNSLKRGRETGMVKEKTTQDYLGRGSENPQVAEKKKSD